MASATAGGGTIDQTPPAATMRSGAGSPADSGVASTSRPSAARAAAIRSATPSAVESAHGAIRSSRSRSRSRCRSEATVVQPSTRSTVASSGSAGARPALGTIATSTPAGSDGPAGVRRGPEAAVVADLDELDAAVEHVGEGQRGRPEHAPGVVDGQRQGGQQVAQRRPRGAGPGGGREQRLAGPGVEVAERGRALGHRAGEDHEPLRAPGGGGRDEGRQLGEGAALVGPGRVAGAGQDAVGARRRAASGTWPAGRSSPRSPRPSASRSGPRRRRAARAPVPRRPRRPAGGPASR